MRSVTRAGIGFFKLDRRRADGLFKGADQVGRVAESAACECIYSGNSLSWK